MSGGLRGVRDEWLRHGPHWTLPPGTRWNRGSGGEPPARGGGGARGPVWPYGGASAALARCEGGRARTVETRWQPRLVWSRRGLVGQVAPAGALAAGLGGGPSTGSSGVNPVGSGRHRS